MLSKSEKMENKMAEAVYLLCAFTSFACSVLLLRGYRRSNVRLLLWSGLCFLGLAINNALIFVDVIVVPNMDLSLIRNLPNLAGVILIIYGLAWDSR
jgi:hypothetical protein